MTRLFNLDFQLLHDSALLAISVFFLFLILSYLLFNPIRKVLHDRQNRIASDIANAKDDKAEAAKLKEEYEAKIATADQKVEEILEDARKRALANEQKIISDAKEEAGRIVQHAREEAVLEQKKAEDEMKQQMIAVAALMAQKVVSAQIDTNIQESLVNETLSEMGSSTWQS